MGQTTSSGSVHDKYFIQKVKLGQGSFGTVWRGVDRDQGHTVAIKQLDRASLPKRGVRREDIEREVTMMKACSHPNLTKLFDYYEDSQSIYLCLEYCDGGDFGDKVKEKGMNLQEHEAADWVRQICDAIHALHLKSICHRDIKPDNFMVSGDTLKLSDFGLALCVPKGKYLTDRCGTPAFMAPEQHALPRNSKGYNFPVDMWAAGVSMYMLMFGGRHPFLTSDGKLDDSLLARGTLDFRENQGWFAFGAQGPLRYSERARGLCQAMVNPKPEKRLSAEDSLKSDWFSLVRQPRRKPTQELAGGGDVTPANGREASTPSAAGKAGNATPRGRNDWWNFAAGMGAGAQATPDEANPTAAPTVDPSMLGENQQLRADRHRLTEEKNVLARQLEALQAEVNKQVSNGLGRWGSEKAKKVLPKGTPCMYYSEQYGFLKGRADSDVANDDGCSFDLDIRKQAAPEKISPAEGVSEKDAWPVGTLVAYHSSSNDKWFPAEVRGYNESDHTYNLDVRPHAEVSRIRLRIGNRLPTGPANPNEAVSSGGPPDGKDRDTSAADAPWRFLGQGGAGSQTAMKGKHCQVTESEGPDAKWLPAVIEGLDGSQATVWVSARRTTVPISAVRAPNEERFAWPNGTEVMYESKSTGKWQQATVLGFANGSYNLNIREEADPLRIRPAC